MAHSSVSRVTISKRRATELYTYFTDATSRSLSGKSWLFYMIEAARGVFFDGSQQASVLFHHAYKLLSHPALKV